MPRVDSFFKELGVLLAVNLVKCSIDGVTFMDSRNMRRPSLYPRGEDPCNPLYWYPRNIPEYCQYRNFPIPTKPTSPALPMPIPVPMPPLPPLVIPMPAIPVPVPGIAPIPFGSPIVPGNFMLPSVSAPVMLPAPSSLPSNLYQNVPQLAGMVPGLPGLVTDDGGINILPFSDAYSDLIEKHKNQMIRRQLNKLMKEYKDFPNRRSYKRLREYARRSM